MTTVQIDETLLEKARIISGLKAEVDIITLALDEFVKRRKITERIKVSEFIKTKNIPHKSVEVNSLGHIIVDKDKDPELYDWAVNG
ncbi:MAG: type II toxin-antitoxin system VapB family antitoxin [Oscillospiraceae bacterium]|nr:type II toxin-antitoxin system VapB family antitoxin [Oscillospiraceae bacterium]